MHVIAYIPVRLLNPGDNAGLRTAVADGDWGGEKFRVSHQFATGGGRLFITRDAHPSVMIDITDLVQGVLIAQDEANPVSEDWQPLKRSVTVIEGDGTERPLNDDEELWGNNLYTVRVDRQPGFTHLSYHRHDRAPVRDWRHAQRIKNDVCGDETEGVELFPAESRLVDQANEYHIWCSTSGPFPLGFNEGRQVLSASQSAELTAGTKTRQR